MIRLHRWFCPKPVPFGRHHQVLVLVFAPYRMMMSPDAAAHEISLLPFKISFPGGSAIIFAPPASDIGPDPGLDYRAIHLKWLADRGYPPPGPPVRFATAWEYALSNPGLSLLKNINS